MLSQNKTKVKLIFFGSFGFAVPVLEALVSAGYEVVAVVTNPDKPSGRKKILTPPPVKITAQKLGLKIIQNFLRTYELTHLRTDVGIVVGYGKIIPPEILNLPKHGLLNIHPSLLPKYRGPSPVQTAILNGDPQTGVTIMLVDEEIDHGPILANQELRIMNDESSEELHRKLFELGTELLIKILPDYTAGRIKPVPQDHSQATFTHKFSAEDAEIKPDDTAKQAYNKVRAFTPEPGAYIILDRKDTKMRLKILKANLVAQLLSNLVVELLSNRLAIVSGQLALKLKDGYIILAKVQPEGKRPMTGQDFVAGYLR